MGSFIFCDRFYLSFYQITFLSTPPPPTGINDWQERPPHVISDTDCLGPLVINTRWPQDREQLRQGNQCLSQYRWLLQGFPPHRLPLRYIFPNPRDAFPLTITHQSRQINNAALNKGGIYGIKQVNGSA